MERRERESTWYREIGEKLKLSDLGPVERGETRDSMVMGLGRYEVPPGPPGVVVNIWAWAACKVHVWVRGITEIGVCADNFDCTATEGHLDTSVLDCCLRPC